MALVYAAAGGTTAALLTNSPRTVLVGPATLWGWDLFNGAAATTWVQVFDALAASVTLGTTPPKYAFPVAAGASLLRDYGIFGVGCSTGLVVAATTTPTGSTAPATGLTAMVLYSAGGSR
jgi:hypothetical protein